MKCFEYKITPYPLSSFKEVEFFCSEKGECSLQEVSSSLVDKFVAMLNERGKEGWELVQLFSRPSGVVALWKREKE